MALDKGSREAIKSSLKKALEDVRIEATKRLAESGLPSYIDYYRPKIIEDYEKSSWTVDRDLIKISSLNNRNVKENILDRFVTHENIDFPSQLEPAAKLIDELTGLGSRAPGGMFPEVLGYKGILMRFLSTFAIEYLENLSDMTISDDKLAEKLIDDFLLLINSKSAIKINQIALYGIVVPKAYYDSGITIRPLTPEERGQFEDRTFLLNNNPPLKSDFVYPNEFPIKIPETLIMIEEKYPFGTIVSDISKSMKICLALFLLDYDLGTPGGITEFFFPKWSMQAKATISFIIKNKLLVKTKIMTESDFKLMVKLANKIPGFGLNEKSSEEISLNRALQGFSKISESEGLLDFVISLEAALLRGIQNELDYRFALYGSLFLKDDYDKETTFKELRQIYSVRSKLVHGSPQKKEYDEATRNAPRLVRAILKRSLEHGWPDHTALDKLALETK